MKKKIAVLPGDGIGPEVMKEAIKVLDIVAERFEHTFEYKEALVGAAAIDATGNPFPSDTLQVCQECDAILFGAIGHPKYDNDPRAKVRPEQGLLAMRKALNLFANLRPVATYEALWDASPLKNDRVKGVDFIVYRELTGGIYFGQPRGRTEDGKTAFDTCVYHEFEILRIAELAFKEAKKRGSKLTLVDKANVLASSRLWREVVKKFRDEKYPEVAFETMFVDNAAMKLITWPAHFGVVLTENMFGDILTDEASVITGSLGMLPSASVGDKYALYEPIHGSYPEAAGQGIANPMATILSAAMLLDMSFNMHAEAKVVQHAVNSALLDGYVTQDINPTKYYSTAEVGSYIAELVRG